MAPQGAAAPRLGTTVLRHNSSPTVLSDCRSGCWSATLQRTPELGLLCYLVQSNCFVIIVRQLLVTTTSILVEIVDSRLENSDETFSFRKQCSYTNLLVHNYGRCLSKGRVLQRFSSICFFTGIQPNVKKS